MNSNECRLNETDDFPVKNGIEICEDLCKCGAQLRLHTHIFRSKSKVMYYVDCPKCRTTSKWHDTTDAAIEEFDRIRDRDRDFTVVPSVSELFDD